LGIKSGRAFGKQERQKEKRKRRKKDSGLQGTKTKKPNSKHQLRKLKGQGTIHEGKEGQTAGEVGVIMYPHSGETSGRAIFRQLRITEYVTDAGNGSGS
jgi:hypothetical protein